MSLGIRKPHIILRKLSFTVHRLSAEAQMDRLVSRDHTTLTVYQLVEGQPVKEDNNKLLTVRLSLSFFQRAAIKALQLV